MLPTGPFVFENFLVILGLDFLPRVIFRYIKLYNLSYCLDSDCFTSLNQGKRYTFNTI